MENSNRKATSFHFLPLLNSVQGGEHNGYRYDMLTDFQGEQCKLSKELSFFHEIPYHLPLSHLAAVMPRMKTMAANVPIIAAYLSAVMLSWNTMDARRPSLT